MPGVVLWLNKQMISLLISRSIGVTQWCSVTQWSVDQKVLCLKLDLWSLLLKGMFVVLLCHFQTVERKIIQKWFKGIISNWKNKKIKMYKGLLWLLRIWACFMPSLRVLCSLHFIFYLLVGVVHCLLRSTWCCFPIPQGFRGFYKIIKYSSRKMYKGVNMQFHMGAYDRLEIK